jgi:hypothetical protein
MGDMSSESAGHGRTGTFYTFRNCVQILSTWSHALSCWNMRWWRWMNGTTMGLRISSLYLCIQIAINKMQLCLLSVAYAAHTITLLPPWDTLFTTSAQLHSWNLNEFVKSTLLQHASGHRRWAFAHWSLLRRQTAVRSRPWWGQLAGRWASLRLFLTVCAQFHQLSKWLVSDDPTGEDNGCGGCYVVFGCEPGWTYWQIL